MVSSVSDNNNQRVPVITAVTCELGHGVPQRILSMLDLSEGGFFVQTAYPLPVGTRVKCTFHLGDRPDPIHVQAEVAWIRPGPEDLFPPPGMGLRFLRLNPMQLDRIRTTIAVHNHQIQFFQQHHRLPEDGMMLSPPRIQLEPEGGGKLETRLEAFSASSLVVTMALPFESGQKVRVGSENLCPEQGVVNWIQFVPNGRSGPELAVGIELQMHNWGQQDVQRQGRTDELSVQTGEAEWDYEILEAIPATAQSGETLPLCDSPATVGALTDTSHCEPTSGPAATFTNTTPMARTPLPNPDFGIPRFPGPVITTDTYPVARSTSAGTGPFNLRAVVLLFLLMAGVLLVIGLLHKTEKDIRRTSPKSNRILSLNQLMEVPEPSFKPCVGTAVVRVSTQTPEPEPKEPDIQNPKEPVAPPKEMASTPEYSVSGSVTRFRIALKDVPTSKNHYLLANPSGVVIDLEGAQLVHGAGFLAGDGKRIRTMKVVPMSTRGRLIVYTHVAPGRVVLEHEGNILTVSLKFPEAVASRYSAGQVR